jgi:hypothetical protein
MRYSNGYKRTSLNIRQDLHKAAKQAAINRDIYFQDWLGEAIEEKLQREEVNYERSNHDSTDIG